MGSSPAVKRRGTGAHPPRRGNWSANACGLAASLALLAAAALLSLPSRDLALDVNAAAGSPLAPREARLGRRGDTPAGCTVVRYDVRYPLPGSGGQPESVPVCAEDAPAPAPDPAHTMVRRLFEIVETDEDAEPITLHRVGPHLAERDGAAAAGDTKKCTVLRYDGYFPYPGAELEYRPVCAEDQAGPAKKVKRHAMRRVDPARELSPRRVHRLRSRELDNPFNITLSCTTSATVTQATCAKVLAGFQSAGKRIARALQITTPIRVQAQFLSFCADLSASTACGSVNGVTTLGQAGPAANIPVTMADGTEYNVPQALFKNANLSESGTSTIQLNAYDIIAQFNSDYNFWFNDNVTAISRQQVDFEFIVMHEFIHGCGFASGWSTWFTTYIGGNQTYLTPNYYTFRGDNGVTTWGGWNPANVFDRYIVENATRTYLTAAYTRVTNFTGQRSQTVSQFVQSFQAGGAPFVEAQRVYSVVASGPRALFFQPEPSVSNNSVWLQTYRGAFEQGSSIGHTSDDYAGTADFLMGAAIMSGNLYGKSLDDIVAQQAPQGYKFGAMGPLLVAVMASIGWPVMAGALSNASFTGTTLAGGNGTSATGPTSGLFLGPLTMVQFIGIVVGAFGIALLAFAVYTFVRGRAKRRARARLHVAPPAYGGYDRYPAYGAPEFYQPPDVHASLLGASGRPAPPPGPGGHALQAPSAAVTASRPSQQTRAAARDPRQARPSFGATQPRRHAPPPPPRALPAHFVEPGSPLEEEEQLQLALALSQSDGH